MNDISSERPASQATCHSRAESQEALRPPAECQAQGLLALAERCEAATGSDLELDAMIRCAAFAKPGAYVKMSPINGAWCIYETSASGKERLWEPFGLSPEQRLGSFTASLDAAMTLVPEPRKWALTAAALDDRWQAWAWQDGVNPNWHEAATPALALCAAALRARASR